MKGTRVVLLAATLVALAVGAVYWYTQRAEPDGAAPAAKPALSAETSARAAAGDADAQLELGIWCLEGRGPGTGYRQAAEWLRKAAEAGKPEAQYRLATLFQAGRGVERDFTNAVSWFRKAADQHHVAALYNLGSMCEAGQGMAADTQAAARFFQEAAGLGDPYAQYNLARRCEEGRGVPKNLVEAWKWYELANAGGVPDTLNARQAIQARLTPEQFREAKSAAAEFSRRSAASGKQGPASPNGR